MKKLIKIFENLKSTDTAYRFEYDDSGYHLSLINRQIYPRCWVDNSNDDNNEILIESAENFLHRELPTLEKDWHQRFSGETIEELITDFNTKF